MREVDRIRTQMKRALDGDAWHGPAILEILNGVNAEAAASRPIPAAHSIWEIVLHLIGTQELLLDRMKGIARDLPPEQDWPVVPESTQAAWLAAVSKLTENDRRLAEETGRFGDERLDGPLVPTGSSAYENLHGHVQHNLYHAGQMAILRKAIETR